MLSLTGLCMRYPIKGQKNSYLRYIADCDVTSFLLDDTFMATISLQ